MMSMDINRHLDEEEIERYSLGDFPESDLARVEEHLLLCPSCQQRVESSDIFVRSMQQAAARVRREPEPARRWLGMPRFALAFGAAALLLAAVFLVPRQTLPPFAVSLSATRGAGIEAKAPEGRTLSLQLDITGLAPADSYRVEMVDRSGKQVWTGMFPATQVKPCPAGIYFVRLYSSAGGLLREYGLEIAPHK
jgi:hypothetical protein